MRFVVGLGNPGPKYVDTRHNFGFLCIEALSGIYRRSPAWSLVDESSKPRVAQWEHWRGPSSLEVALLWPLTYMNLSGQAVDFLASRLGAPPLERMLVVVDDLSLPLGQLRLRQRGSSGGHNGLKSIEGILGSPDYARLRLGIGQPPAGVEVIDYVLSSFPDEEAPLVKTIAGFSAEKVAEWVEGVSFDLLVGKVNGWRASE